MLPAECSLIVATTYSQPKLLPKPLDYQGDHIFRP